MKFGEIGSYKWIEAVPSRTDALFQMIRRLRQHLRGLKAVNVSWDSGLLVPSDEEERQGWMSEQDRAVSPIIDDAVIDTWPWSDGGFEEWYFFSELPANLNLVAYCNWTGLSLADWESLVDIPTGLNLRLQLETVRPEAVLGMGDRLFAISHKSSLIEDCRRTLGSGV
jgi:hypothetical protein